MAAENQNTGPNLNPNVQGSTSAQKEARELAGVARDVKKEFGDYRDTLRDSIKELQAALKAYDKIEAKLVTINKQTLNLKEVEKQIQATREKSAINEKKILDLKETLDKSSQEAAKKFNETIKNQQKAEMDYIEAKKVGDSRAMDAAQQKLASIERSIESQKENLTVEELSYALALKQKQVDDDILHRLKEQRQEEERVRDNIGVSGFLAQKFADKLGIGETFYKNMVAKAREANRELTIGEKATLIWNSATEQLKKSWNDFKKDPAAIAAGVVALYKSARDGLTSMGNAAKSAANGLGDFMSMTGDKVIGKVASGVAGLLKHIPLVGGLLGGLVEAVGKLAELALDADDAVVKFGREMGVPKSQAMAMNNAFLNMAANGKSLVASNQALRTSQVELSRELGVTNMLSQEQLSTNIELSKLAGLDIKTRGAIIQSSIITGKSAESITKSVMGQVGALKAATGISLDYKKVLSEASNLSGVLGLQFAKYPSKLAASLVTTKALGLELSKLDSMADTFLDFESSISKEFEAQLLTGKDINLSKARELFLNNDLAGAAMEITKHFKSTDEFLNMNRIQQEAIASAMGMQRNELADMLKQQELLSRFGAKDMEDARQKVELLQKQGLSKEQIVAQTGEELYRSVTQLSVQEKIASFVEKIQGAIATFLQNSPIIPLIEAGIDFLSKPEAIRTVMMKIQGVLATVFDVIGGVAAAVMKVANSWPFNAGISQSLINVASSGGDSIRSINLGSGVSVGNNAAANETASSAGGGGGGGNGNAKSGEPVVVHNNITMVSDNTYRVRTSKDQKLVPADITKNDGIN